MQLSLVTSCFNGAIMVTLSLKKNFFPKDLARNEDEVVPVTVVAFSPDRIHLAGGDLRGDLAIYNIETGITHDFTSEIISGQEGAITAVAFSPNGLRVAYTSKNMGPTIEPLLMKSEKPKKSVELDTNGVGEPIAYHPNGGYLAVGGDDLSLWHINKGEIVRSYDVHNIGALAISPNGRFLASGLDEEGHAMVWPATSQAGSEDSGELTPPLQTFEAPVTIDNSIVFSPDNALIADGADDGCIYLLDVTAGTPRKALDGHHQAVKGVSFSPDGTLLAAGCADGSIVIWNAATGSEECTLKAHVGGVNSVAFSPAGTELASGGEDGKLALWSFI